ncbi:MAG: manganese efflux pump [Clostridia bacterium]|nr:manganese efflux pump [Clostridia bacterium]
MKLYELILLAAALSMDACAVSICKGLSMRRINYAHALIISLSFGVFQALMPTIGWFLGSRFESYIVNIDHWIAFALLAFLGAKMLYETFTDKEEEIVKKESLLDLKEVFVLSVATSIDALAAGITLACLNVNIISSASLIGILTFGFCFIGVIIGNKFGAKYKSKAEIAGGAVLILIGLKILLEHLGIINF